MMLATFALVTYQQEAYVRAALEAALAQDYEPLQIVVSDDCSGDRTFDIVREIASASRRPIGLNRNPRNLGLAGNVNAVMGMARGEIVIIAAGDDVSRCDRATRIVERFAREPEAFSVHSNMLVTDADDRPIGPWIAQGRSPPLCDARSAVESGVGVLGATHAWRREVFDVFGPIDSGVVREDAIIPFRSALLGRVSYIDEQLVRYRRHESNVYQLRAQMPAARLRADWTLHLRGDHAVALNMLRDLETYRARGGDAGRLADALQGSLEARIDRVSEELRFATASPLAAAAQLLGGLARGSPSRQLARWGAMRWMPRLYLRHVRRVVRRRGDSPLE